MRQLEADEKSILLGHVRQINERLKVIGSDNDRLDILNALKDEICPECGRLNAKGHRCCCIDDEDYE